MGQEKLIRKFWLYNYLPSKIINLMELIRFEKPIGTLLLMWPCWYVLAISSYKQIKLYFLFIIGSFCMRSVGCIINDSFDRNIDKTIKRTSNRPLAAGKIKFYEAMILMVIFLLVSLLILLQFNFYAIIVALFSMPLVIIYPLMKRYTHWPQLILGITFSWGVLVASFELFGTISTKIILLYIACIFWTLGYDTIYAYQDRDDDIKANLNSTAILFGNKGKFFVMLFYSLFIFFIWIATNLNEFVFSKTLILFFLLICLLSYLNRWNINSTSSSNSYFKFNNIIGLICYLYLFISSYHL